MPFLNGISTAVEPSARRQREKHFQKFLFLLKNPPFGCLLMPVETNISIGIGIIEVLTHNFTTYLVFLANCFIKMLGQLPKAGFSAKRVEGHAKKYYEKLLSMPIDKADQAFEIEVIPYEDLWELVVESL